MTAQTEKGQHTPGPWRLRPNLPRDGRGNVRDGKGTPRGSWEITPEGHDHAIVFLADHHHADARLIAAAPALLEALRAFYAERTAADGDGCDCLTCEQARAAIKLVEGERNG